MKPAFFRAASDFRDWLAEHHAAEAELWVRLRKTGATGPGMAYAQALDRALCFGWIDGVRKAFDGDSFATRFSPRKPRSIWSKVNLRHFARLKSLGLVAAPGRAAFESRDPKRSGLYSFESRPKELPPESIRAFQRNRGAWAFFTAQAPWYRKTATFWVVSAKREATRERRLKRLIADSAQGRRIGPLARPGRGLDDRA